MRTRLLIRLCAVSLATIIAQNTVSMFSAENVLEGGTLSLAAKVSAQSLTVNASYFVLNPGAAFQLNANVSPQEGNQNMSNNITAKIVMASNNDIISVDGTDCGIINSAMLKELYGTDKQLIIHYSEYSIFLHGRDIKNIDNELNTRFTLSPVEQGLEVLVNDGYNLPGRLTIELKSQPTYLYLYLFDDNKNAYSAMGTLNDYNRFSVDIGGKYLLRQNEISDAVINWTVIILIGILALALLIAYIAVKKRHWFW